MNKIISLALLIVALCALQNTEIHQQARPVSPTPNSYPASNSNYRPPVVTPITPATPVAPAPIVKPQPHREPGYQPTPGNPYGRDPKGPQTCFQSPCFDPTTSCTKTVKVASRPVNRSTSRVVNGKKVSFSSGPSPLTTQTKIGTWKPIVYVVRVNGQKARFVGFRCV